MWVTMGDGKPLRRLLPPRLALRRRRCCQSVALMPTATHLRDASDRAALPIPVEQVWTHWSMGDPSLGPAALQRGSVHTCRVDTVCAFGWRILCAAVCCDVTRPDQES